MKHLVIILSLYVSMAYAVQRVELVIPTGCAKQIEMGKHFECVGPDESHMVCRGIVITYSKQCEELRIVK